MNLEDERAPAATNDVERPLVPIRLIAYNPAGVVADAVAGALAQTYPPLEILISDDCSPDGTFAAIEAAVRGYRGPHRVVLNRNTRNGGISGHLSQLARMAHGELLIVAAGDDVSVSARRGNRRCRRTHARAARAEARARALRKRRFLGARRRREGRVPHAEVSLRGVSVRLSAVLRAAGAGAEVISVRASANAQALTGGRAVTMTMRAPLGSK